MSQQPSARGVKNNMFWLSRTFFLLTVSFLIVCVHAGPVLSGELEGKVGLKGQGKIVIQSDTLEMDNKKKMVTFTGRVSAKNDDFVMDCEKMVVYYISAPSKKGPKETSTEIDRIVATGKVEIVRSLGGTASADKAVYHQVLEQLVLTGNPVVKQENNYVEGNRITLFIKEDRSVVEGSGDNRAKAVIFPGQKKGTDQ